MLVFLHQPQNWIYVGPSLPQEVMGSARGVLPGILFPFVVLCNQLFSCCFTVLFSLLHLKAVMGSDECLALLDNRQCISRTFCNSVQLDVAVVKCSHAPEGNHRKFCWKEPLKVTWPNPADSAAVVTWTPLGCMGLKRTCSREQKSRSLVHTC